MKKILVIILFFFVSCTSSPSKNKLTFSDEMTFEQFKLVTDQGVEGVLNASIKGLAIVANNSIYSYGTLDTLGLTRNHVLVNRRSLSSRLRRASGRWSSPL